LFQNIGAGAYKEGLGNTEALDAHHGHPHTKYLTIHVAGTNGKGSTSHTLAAILQSAGYKVGLYTSPHLVDFNERFQIGNQPISDEAFIYYVKKAKNLLLNTDKPIESIISECGFSNRTEFFKKFYALEGVTPLQFRKNQK
jgi:folylpolyglutamate synthase/dihydropteroate synthase